MNVSLSGNRIVIQSRGQNHEFAFDLEGEDAKVKIPYHLLCLLDFEGVRQITHLLRKERNAVHVSVCFD